MELWGKAHQEGLDIPETPPDWVQTLGDIHGNPYYLRYSTGINALMTPGLEPATTELRAVLTKANEFVRTRKLPHPIDTR